jgi:hypothetical protein
MIPQSNAFCDLAADFTCPHTYHIVFLKRKSIVAAHPQEERK